MNQVAFHHMPLHSFPDGRVLVSASVRAMRTSGTEGTSGRKIRGIRHQACDGTEALRILIEIRNGTKQPDGIRMLPLLVNILQIAVLDNLRT